MGLGLTRESVGDILVAQQSADVLVSAAVADHLLQSWDSAGRVHLRTAEVELSHLHIPVAKCRIIRDTVSSLRLDSVVSSAFPSAAARRQRPSRAGGYS